MINRQSGLGWDYKKVPPKPKLICRLTVVAIVPTPEEMRKMRQKVLDTYVYPKR